MTFSLNITLNEKQNVMSSKSYFPLEKRLTPTGKVVLYILLTKSGYTYTTCRYEVSLKWDNQSLSLLS